MRRLLAFIAFALLAPALGAQELGRLFFTPEQRAALDARRKARVPDRAAPLVAAPLTRVDGYVKRSTGPSTVWVNGESMTENAPEAPRIDERRSGVSLGIGEGHRVELKAGETLDRGNGEVRDVLGDGEIRVRPADAAR
jgi:hypothetical protein